jgi:CRP-like cAMP-binding protein
VLQYMSLVKMMDAFIAALMKKDSKRTEVDRFDIAQFLRCAGLYHSKILQSVLSFATVENCKTDYVIYAQHDMVGLQYWYLLKGQVRLYSSKKGRFQFVKPGSTMQATRESLAELGKYEYIVQQGDFFGVESFVESDPHAERKHSALATADGTIILPIQGATPLRHAIDYIRLPHQYQVHTLSKWCNISPELRSDHEVSLILNHLKGFKFFSRLPDHLGLSWAKMCMVVNVKAQTLLFQQNDPSDSIYFIIDGSCQVRIKKLNEPVKVPTGDGNLNWLTMDADFGDCVHTFESGDSFGELSLDHAKANQTPRRTASIICTQECVLLRVDAEAYYTLQKMGQNSRIILSQWTKPLQSAPGSRSSETIDTISFIMLDFKYFSFMNEYTRRILAQNLFLIDTEPGDIIFVEGETVFVQSMNASIDESILQPKSPNAVRKWTTDSVCAVVCGSVGAFKKKKTNESGTHDVASYLHLNTAQKINAISDVFGILQSTIVAGEGFGEDLLHRKSLDVKRNLSYVCLEPCKLVFYGQKSFASTLSPTYDLGSGKSKMIMRKPSEQRTHRDLCIIFREVASLPFIQNFVEHDFHDFFSKARFGNCPAFSVINKSFPKYCFGIVLSGAMSVHQSEEQELHKNDVATVKDAQCHAIRLMFGACKHIVKEGDIFGEYNLKSVSEKMKSSLDIIPSRCTYISRVPTEMIYWDVYDLSPKLLEESQKGIASTGRVIQIMAKSFNQKTDDDVAVLDEFLRSFKHLSQYPDLSRILSSSAFSMQELDDSDVIFREGDSVTHLYILLQGSIQTHSKLKPDPELYTGRTIFGEMSVDEFYSIGSRFSTCTVAENSTFVLQIPFEAFLQLEKQKMAAIYRSAKSYLVQHHCFKKLCSKNLSLVDDLVSDCRILFKSKNDPLYVEGHVYDRSIWAVLKGSVELILYANPGVQNSDDLVLDIKMNDFGQSTNSSAKAAFSKQSTFRHSLGVLRTGAAIAPFAVSDVQQQFYRAAADHDAAAAENDTIVAVFFMRNSKDESKAAMCMMEQEIAFLSQWRQLRKKAGDHAIVHQRSLITSPKKIALGFSASISSHQYHTVRPKTGLEGKVDSNLFLPKLAGSRRVDIIHNDDILDVNGDRFAVLSESSLQDIYVKCTRQSEEVCMDQESSKPCPSPREINNMERYEDMGNHRELIPAENTPDVGKKILDIFAADKFKRKAFMTLEIDHRHVPGVHAVSEANKVMNNSIAGSSESKSGHSSSPESQAIESKAAQMR